MKITLELPDQVLRKVKTTAAEHGQSVKEFVAEALRDKLVQHGGRACADTRRWVQGFGKLRRLHKETLRVQSVIDREFEVLELEDRC